MKILDIFKKQDQKPEPKEKKAVKKAVATDSAASGTTLKVKAEPVLSPKKEDLKDKKKKSDDTKDAYKILIKPLVTERATELAALGKYCFMAASSSNKPLIAKAIKDLYGVNVKDVNIVNVRGKAVSYRQAKGKKKNWKKAIITLNKGEKIDVYEGV